MEEWDGSMDFKPRQIFSCGDPYVVLKRRGKRWSFVYRMGLEGVEIPEVLSRSMVSPEDIHRGVLEFADWAMLKGIRLIEAHERTRTKYD